MEDIDINKTITDCIRKEILLFLKQSAESGNVIDQYRFGHYLRNSFYDDDDEVDALLLAFRSLIICCNAITIEMISFSLDTS